MRRYEKRTKTFEETVLAECRCDLCGVEHRPCHEWPGVGEDAGSPYRVASTEVQCETGTSYPEGGEKTVTSFDICPACFLNKLVPWLKSQGAEARVEEVNW